MKREIIALALVLLLLPLPSILSPKANAGEILDKDKKLSEGDPEISISNDDLFVYVEYGESDGIGTFTMETHDHRDLLYTSRDHDAWSSYITVQVDGVNYVSGVSAGFGRPISHGDPVSMNDYVSEDPYVVDNAIITSWILPGEVFVTQTIELLGPAAKFQITIENMGTANRNVKIRSFLDYQVKDQDGAPIYIPDGGLIKKETKYTGDEIGFDYWLTRDYVDSTYTTQGRHTLSTRPYTVIFAHYYYAAVHAFEYDDFDPTRSFYTPGEIQSPESDSCSLLYWDLASISPSKTKNIVTYYGSGAPKYVDIEAVITALDDYGIAVIEDASRALFNYASGMAKGYKKWGSRFKDNLIEYLSNRTGEESFSELADKAYGEYINGSIGEQDATTLTEMFDRVNTDMSEQDMANEFHRFLIERANPLIEGFEEDFGIYKEWIIGNLTEIQSELSSSDLEMFADVIRNSETELLHPSRVSERFLELMEQAAEERPGPYYIGNVEFHESPGIIVAFVIMLAIGIVGTWLIHEVAEHVGAESFAVSGETTADEAWQAAEHATGGISMGISLLSAPGQITNIAAAIEGGLMVHPLLGIAFIVGHVIEYPAEEYIEDVVPATQTVTDFSEYLFHQKHVDLEILSHTASNVTEPIDSNEILGKGEGKITIKNVGDLAVEPKVTREDITIDGPVVDVKTVEIPERLLPDEEGVIEYEYVVNLASIDSPSCGWYTSSVRIHASRLIKYTTSSVFKACKDEPAESIATSIVSEGTIVEGESSEVDLTMADDTERAVFSLLYTGSDLDMHLYDDYGNHVGLNYYTGDVESQIEGASYSGPATKPEWMEIVGDITSRSYTLKIIAVTAEEAGTDYVLVSREVPQVPPIMDLSPKHIELTLEPTDERGVHVYTSETGGQFGLSNVLLQATDLVCGGKKIPRSNIQFSVNNFDVEAGSSVFIVMSVSVPERTIAGTYVGDLTATDENGISDQSQIVVQIPPPPAIPVYVDIKPASWPNPFQLKSKGVLPAAICDTEDFDVTTIDPATIRLTMEDVEEGVAPLRWSYEDVATPYEGEPCSGHDLAGDGYLDLTLKFKTQEVVETLGLDAFEDRDIVILILTGNLKEEFGGTPIQGQDCVRIQK